MASDVSPVAMFYPFRVQPLCIWKLWKLWIRWCGKLDLSEIALSWDLSDSPPTELWMGMFQELTYANIFLCLPSTHHHTGIVVNRDVSGLGICQYFTHSTCPRPTNAKPWDAAIFCQYFAPKHSKVSFRFWGLCGWFKLWWVSIPTFMNMNNKDLPRQLTRVTRALCFSFIVVIITTGISWSSIMMIMSGAVEWPGLAI